MLNTDAFVTALYVMVDDFCKEHLPKDLHCGPRAGLDRSEIISLAIFGEWGRFSSESDFYRFADEQLRGAFPHLPSRSRYNRLARRYDAATARFGLYLSSLMQAEQAALQAIDCTAVPMRDYRRRGNSWLLGDVSIGKSSRLGWFEGFRLLIAVDTAGVITGYCFSDAATNDRHLAEALFALRREPSPRVATTGRPFDGVYLGDKGFAGKRWLPRWLQDLGALLLAQGQREEWSRALRRWIAHHRQIVETVFEKLHNVFGLVNERAHTLDGFRLRLNARIALHNFCIWLNRSLGREPLMTADLLAWS